MKVACGVRRGPFALSFYERATAGWPVAERNLATAVCVTLRTPQITATALDGVGAEA